MTWLVSDELVPVELEACHCPGTPHAHDTVWLRPTLSASGGMAGMYVIGQGISDPEQLEQELARVYLEHGIARWTFVDEQGQPVPVEKDTIRHMTWTVAYPIADKASDLYSQDLLRPLVARASALSQNGHTAKSTSARRRTSSARQRR